MHYFGNISTRLEGTPSYTARFNTLHTFPQRLAIPETIMFKGSPHQPRRIKTPHIDLKTGDRLTIFNSISAGQTLWKGELNFSKNSSNPHPFGINPLVWKAMHAAGLPAKLTKGDTGEIIDGMLADSVERPDDFYHLFDFHNKSYESIQSYSNGDTLEIFSGITAGSIFWQGDIKTYAKPVATSLKTYSITEDGILDFDKKVDEYKGNKLINPGAEVMRDYRMIRYPAMLERD